MTKAKVINSNEQEEKTWYWHHKGKQTRFNEVAIKLIKRRGLDADKFIHSPIGLLADRPEQFINICGLRIGYKRSDFFGESRIHYCFFNQIK